MTNEEKAARAVGWGVGNNVDGVLYANGAMFSPRWFDSHAMAVLFEAQTNGFVGPTGDRAMFDISVAFQPNCVTVIIGAKLFKRAVDGEPHNAFRLALLDAFGAYYDAILA